MAIALACAPPAVEPAAAPPAIDTAGVTQAIADLWSRMATADTANNPDGVLALYSADARVDAPGTPAMIGRAAIDSTLRPMYAMRDYTSLVITPAGTTVLSNVLVYQRGTYTESYIEKKKSSTEYGRYATGLVKEADGQWRITYMMAFPDSTVQRR
jgi:uncharacterized protein (TIGR02246 family)